jgi:hypothetical protein
MSEPTTETTEAIAEKPPAWVHVARATAAAGALSVSYGAWLAYQPAGYIVGGLLLLSLGLGALRG